ncbi:MAG: sarcosine oxidase subunit gamma family protein [Rhizobiales bacterium]|nr:sarcosine oxidase subunit gamma family protein [Hyphomicrobiales bacterium]
MAELVTITTLPPATRFVVRGGEAAIPLIGRAFGVALPRDACRAASVPPRAALWLGPDEWLLLAPDGDGERIASEIGAALTGAPASVVDISDRQVALSVGGPRAATVVNAFNPLDLHPEAFPVGMCTRTVFAKAEIVLWRTAADGFRIEVWRSFAPYVEGLLREAAEEYA